MTRNYLALRVSSAQVDDEKEQKFLVYHDSIKCRGRSKCVHTSNIFSKPVNLSISQSEGYEMS